MENFPTADLPSLLSPTMGDEAGRVTSDMKPRPPTRSILSLFDDASHDSEVVGRSDFSVPPYYLRSATGGPGELKLSMAQVKQFSLDALFSCFHCLPDDVLQSVAATELVTRGWRYHRDHCFWMRPSNAGDRELLLTVPVSTQRPFVIFDPATWTHKLFQGQMDHARLMVPPDHNPSSRAPSMGSLKTSPPGTQLPHQKH
jgi:hypothetical protein